MTKEVREAMTWVEVEDVAQAMYQLVVDENMGDGTILEVLASGTRVLPRFPGASDEMLQSLAGYSKSQELFLNHLKGNGLKL